MADTDSFVSRSSRYFSESVDELKKVSSPTRAETIQATVVTLFLVVLVSGVVALMDLAFGQLMKTLLG
ncbi:MAG: preprotein translocase subunit SecE [Proteobacteria bacterium]|nr:MAG: preprotein translocase subunit SecE [Pseudomonadota bacterium]